MDEISWIPLIRVQIKKALREPVFLRFRTGPGIPSYIGIGLKLT